MNNVEESLRQWTQASLGGYQNKLRSLKRDTSYYEARAEECNRFESMLPSNPESQRLAAEEIWAFQQEYPFFRIEEIGGYQRSYSGLTINETRAAISEAGVHAAELTTRAVSDLRSHLARIKAIEETAINQDLESLDIDAAALALGDRFDISFDGRCLQVVTPHIYMKWVQNEEVAWTYYMGIAEITIPPYGGGSEIYARAHAYNSWYGDAYWHPHVSCDGVVCLGDMHALVNDMWANLDIVGIVSAVFAVLTNYNSDSPYKPITQWSWDMGAISNGIAHAEPGVRLTYWGDEDDWGDDE